MNLEFSLDFEFKCFNQVIVENLVLFFLITAFFLGGLFETDLVLIKLRYDLVLNIIEVQRLLRHWVFCDTYLDSLVLLKLHVYLD